MMFSCTTCLLKRRSAFSTVSPSWSLTSAKRHLHPGLILPGASYGLYRCRSRLAVSQLFRQFLAGFETRIPFGGDGDGLPGARVAALALHPVFHDEAAKPAQVYPFVCLERFRDHRQDRVHCYFNLRLLQFGLGGDLLNQLLFCHSFEFSGCCGPTTQPAVPGAWRQAVAVVWRVGGGEKGASLAVGTEPGVGLRSGLRLR